MSPIQLHSRVGKDGVLTVRVPLTPSDADAEVLVTIEPLSRQESPQDWKQFIESTYGSCGGLRLERPEQGELQEPEALE